MQVNLIDHNKLIEVNNLKEVKDSIFFEKNNYPTEEGLLSYSIFGRPGSEERKTIFAYIDLKEYFLHPIILKTLIRLDRNFEALIFATEKFSLNEKNELIKDENGKTGLTYLYSIYHRMVLKKTDSKMRNERIDLIMNTKREHAFQSKCLIIPAFYRDVNYKDLDRGRIKPDEINELYAKIMRLVQSLKENEGMDFAKDLTKNNIQLTLIEIYEYFTGYIKGKSGIFHQAILGKTIDYGFRSVISVPNFNYDSYKEMPIDFEHVGVPLSQLCVLFFPFFVKFVQDFMSKELMYINKIEKVGSSSLKKLVDPMDDFTYTKIEKQINKFIKVPGERFELIKIKTEDGYKEVKLIGRMHNIENNEFDSDISNRFMTWTDLLYLAALEVTKDKHVSITRYPVNDYFGMFISKIAVLSTKKTTKQVIEGKEFKYYPIIDTKLSKDEVANCFVDTLALFTPYLAVMDADYDGVPKGD